MHRTACSIGAVQRLPRRPPRRRSATQLGSAATLTRKLAQAGWLVPERASAGEAVRRHAATDELNMGRHPTPLLASPSMLFRRPRCVDTPRPMNSTWGATQPRCWPAPRCSFGGRSASTRRDRSPHHGAHSTPLLASPRCGFRRPTRRSRYGGLQPCWRTAHRPTSTESTRARAWHRWCCCARQTESRAPPLPASRSRHRR